MHEIRTELLRSILNYLSKRPFDEVYQFIQEIQKCKQVEGNMPEAGQDRASERGE